MKTPNSKPDIRHLNDMKNVLYDKKWAKTAPNSELYYMYRGVKEPRKNRFATRRSKKNGLRYDITVIPSRMLGKEFVKTKGHRHIHNFQELIIVLKGKAIYFFQKGNGDKIDEVWAIQAQKKDWIVIPAGYEHLTINPGKQELVMANWISKKCKSDYSLFEKFRGAGYYYTKDGWIKNKNYKKIPKLRFKNPLRQKPKSLNFLYGNH